jgi:hypothetical protein
MGGTIVMKLTPKNMRATFAVLLFVLGVWQALSSLSK